MKLKINLCRSLATLIAGSALLMMLASCGQGDETQETRDTTQTSVESEEITELKDSLPDDLNYNGEKLVFITTKTMSYDEQSGIALEDAIFERNTAVEERLGVSMEFILEDNATDKVVTSVNGGSADYDILASECWRTALKFTGNYFRNLRETEYLDFDQIWWNQSFNDVVLYNGAQYGITGDLGLNLYRRTCVTTFNKELFTNANQPFLYEYVENGSWTLDKQAALTLLFHQDNGNGKQDKTGDVYGFVTNDFIYVDPYWAAGEVDIIKKNAAGEYEWVFDSAKLHDVAEKVLALYYGTDGATYVEKDNMQSEKTVEDMFSSGYAAMATFCIESLEKGQIREMRQEYGVVPIPKYMESQPTYYSQMSDGVTLFCFPTTVDADRADMLSAVLEAMGSTSYRVVRPVYYETVLRVQLAKDPQSAEMLDLIINNLRAEAGFVYSHSMGSFHQGFQALVESEQNDAVSRYKKMSVSAQKKLILLVKELDKLAGNT